MSTRQSVRANLLSSFFSSHVAITMALILTASAAHAQDTFNVLHPFSWAHEPTGQLAQYGSLYGTTVYGGGTGCGGLGCGTIWRLSPKGDGTSSVTILHVFTESEGANPVGGLVVDFFGDLFGTTSAGGTVNSGCFGGCGVAFEMFHNKSNDTYTYQVLHKFKFSDGGVPYAPLLMGSAGILYGETLYGSDTGCFGHGCGTVFTLTPSSSGAWTENVIHKFSGADGYQPQGGLIFDSAGNLYGTTYNGGGQGIDNCATFLGCGEVFRLSQNADFSWSESILYSFTGLVDGSEPISPVTFGPDGNLYGSTFFGGENGGGVVFQLTAASTLPWTEHVLHSFGSNEQSADGFEVEEGVTFDASGNLYGVTSAGGGPAGAGTVFKLTPSASGWNETLVHIFGGYGDFPSAPILIDSSTGHLYGTTGEGDPNSGLVFEITP